VTPDTSRPLSFTSEWARVRVVFGAGAMARLGAEIDALAVTRVLLITTPGRTSGLAPVHEHLGDRVAGACRRAALHVPIDRVRDAVAEAGRVGADALLAIGGGSAIGLAKAVALERAIPIVAVPTTYSGSEMTSIWGITDGDVKRTGRHIGVAPRLVVYDPDLTLTLPAAVSAASGMNAMAHAVEATYAAGAGPVAVAAAEEAIRALARALPAIAARPDDRDARTLALRGAHAAGVALELAAMGLHHKICHVLGGTFGLPHAPTHAAVLPHVAAFNAAAAPEAMARVARALDAADAPRGLHALNRTLGLSATLGSLGFHAADVDRAADLVTAAAYANPRPVTSGDVQAILRAAL
jgi:alcohol dehydrogenase class IV